MKFSFEIYRRFDVHSPSRHAEEQAQEHLVEIFENSDAHIVDLNELMAQGDPPS